MSRDPSPLGGAAAPPRALRHRAIAALCVTLLAAAAGCGKKAGPERVAVYPVEGSITFKGQPMPGAVISFHPKAPQENVPPPRAEINKDGVLKVSTYDGGDGAPEGEYVVTVLWYKLVKNGKDVVAGPNVIPQKYTSAERSDLTTVIKGPGPNKIEFQL